MWTGRSPEPSSGPDVTAEPDELLRRWVAGEPAAFEGLLHLFYDDLREVAAGLMRLERDDHTLQSGTALVHEAYLRLARQSGFTAANRAHFLALMARVMRQVLVDHSRQKKSLKRGGGRRRTTLAESALVAVPEPEELLDLDDALHLLERMDPVKASVVELTYFGGLSRADVAEHLGMSVTTVGRQWRQARAWLFKELRSG